MARVATTTKPVFVPKRFLALPFAEGEGRSAFFIEMNQAANAVDDKPVYAVTARRSIPAIH